MTVEFRLLGEVEALVDGAAVDLGHPRQRLVLAALLVDANRPVPTDRLIERIWADRPPHRARNALSAYLSRLRHQLAGAPEAHLVRAAGGYRLAVPAGAVDLHRFRHLVRQASDTPDPRVATARYQEALGLWRGEPFPAADTPWFAETRTALHAERVAAELDRNDAALRAGRHGELLGELTRAARAQPLDERLAGQLMLAQFRSGRQADALAGYRRIRDRLRDELGADPGAALRAVHQRILTGDPGAPATGAPPTLEPRTLEPPPAASRGDRRPPPGAAGAPPNRPPEGPLERSEPLRRLDELRAAGAGRVALVSGEAGVGKSTLVAAFVTRAAPALRLLFGACDPLLTPRELGPLHDIGRQVGGALAAALAAAGSREAVFAALLDELDAPPDGPLPVLVIEDAHWADGATLDLLTFLGRRIARLRALLVVTFRDDELAVEHPLRATLMTLPREAVVRLPLAPLSPAAVEELARRAGRPTAHVHELTGGNPLLVSELLAAGPSDVPTTVRDLMLARLAPLPAPARAVARLVSVMPGHADPAVLLGTADAVETCLANGVLVQHEGRIAYRHELLRRAVEESLSPVRRAELNAAVLAALADTADPARLAHHARLAGDVPALLRHARAAAGRAAAVNARREAVEQLRTTLPHADRLAEPERAELLHEFAAQAFAAGFPEEGVHPLRQAIALREAAGDAERVGAGLLLLNRLLWWSGQVDEAWAACRRAVAVLETVPAGRQLAMAYSQLSSRYMLANRPEESVEWGQRAIALAERVGDVATAVDTLINIGGARFDMDPAWDGAELEQAHATALAAGLPDQATRSLVNLASTSVQSGRHGPAEPRLDRALQVAVEHDLHGYARFTMGMRARLRVERGDWAGALADAECSREWPGLARNTRIPGLVAEGLVRLRRGEGDALAALDEAAGYAYPMNEMQWVGPVAAARSEYFWLAGDAERAAAEARRWLPLAIQRHRWLAGELALRLWRADPDTVAPAGIDEPYARLLGGDWAGAAAIWAKRGSTWTRAEALSCGDAAAVAEALRVVESMGGHAVAGRWRSRADPASRRS